MKYQQLIKAIRKASQDLDAPLPNLDSAGDVGELLDSINSLILANRALLCKNSKANHYIRKKTNQLLDVIGTIPLKPEELEDDILITMDPIGVVAESFIQILEHQRETNKKLELTMEEIKAIFDAVGCSVLVVDENMHIQAYNDHAQRLFTDFKGEWKGTSCHEIVCRDSRLQQECPFRKVLDSGQPVHFPDWPVRERFFDIVATPVKNKEGKVVYGVLLYHDITFQKQAANAIAAEKEQLAVTLRSIAEGVITTDVDGNIVLMNRIAEKLTGWTQQKAHAKPSCEVFWIVDEKKRSSCINLPRDVMVEGKSIAITDDTVLIARDGYERLISANAAPIYDHDQEIIGVVMVFRDITAEKRVEEELLNARRIESLGILAGGIAHDFNNLLTGILGNITLAKMTADSGTPVVEKLSRAEKACMRARDLTQQLLTFSKGGAPVKKTAAITDFLKETALFALRGSNVQCDFEIAEELWATEIDEGQIAQVINNLVINADQAMVKGGTITVRAENAKISNSKKVPLKPGRYIKITVQDTGPGINPKDIKKIFDPYFSTKKTGSGLGLASCYAVIKKHDGYIHAESKKNRGATFIFYLAASDAPVIDLREEAPDTRIKQTGKILVMDDDEMIRELTSELLTSHDFEVAVSTDGQEAVNSYRKALQEGKPYDVVIMDLTIPGGMGGKEAIQKLREIDPAVKAIVSSGYSMDAAMADFANHGFKAVVPKPYKAATLLRVIQEVLSGNDDQ